MGIILMLYLVFYLLGQCRFWQKVSGRVRWRQDRRAGTPTRDARSADISACCPQGYRRRQLIYFLHYQSYTYSEALAFLAHFESDLFMFLLVGAHPQLKFCYGGGLGFGNPIVTTETNQTQLFVYNSLWSLSPSPEKTSLCKGLS